MVSVFGWPDPEILYNLKGVAACMYFLVVNSKVDRAHVDFSSI
jgi:hypothetical protein